MKYLKTTFIALILLMITYACSNKQQEPDYNLLYLVYAKPYNSGYLPLKIFSENDSLFVQYIKNGKSLEKIELIYSHSEEDKYENTLHYFDEIVNGKKNGSYILPDFIFDQISYLWDGEIIIYKTNDKEIQYCIEWSLSKNRVVEVDYVEYYWYYEPILNSLYSIHSNPKSIEQQAFDEIEKDNIWTSDDGNLRIYCQYFYQGGNGYGHEYPLEVVQYRDGNNVSAFGEIEWWNDDFNIGNFVYLDDIKIHTVLLNNRTYYLIDISMYDAVPCQYLNIEKNDEIYGSGDIEEEYYTNANVLQIYTIENGQLIKQKLFNTKTKTIDNIVIEYDNNSTTNCDKAFSNLFKYDQHSKTIYVPLVKGVTLTNKYLLYQWDGKYFTYKGIK